MTDGAQRLLVQRHQDVGLALRAASRAARRRPGGRRRGVVPGDGGEDAGAPDGAGGAAHRGEAGRAHRRRGRQRPAARGARTPSAAEHGIRLHIPPARLCTDNAAMITAAGTARLAAGERAALTLNATPDLAWREAGRAPTASHRRCAAASPDARAVRELPGGPGRTSRRGHRGRRRAAGRLLERRRRGAHRALGAAGRGPAAQGGLRGRRVDRAPAVGDAGDRREPVGSRGRDRASRSTGRCRSAS